MTIHDILKNYWNYDQFRSLQEDIIRSVLDGRDTLALLPTGGGKSICFQVPALYHVGMCLVISPLIALMKDQVYNLKKRNIPAEAIYTGMTNLETDRILNNAVKGKLKFLYVSPERLKTQTFRDQLQRMHICLLAIDEAHCISQWGYDFRPPYLDIAEIRPQLQGIPILALTATATERVKADIVQRLQFSKNHQVFQKSFTRANLSYSVFEESNKEQRIATILQRVDGTAIVYARNRLLTVELATYLKQQKINADFYHAGLDTKTRTRKQEEWINNQTRVMVCTNAFGMGIDKPDVRLVIHYAPAESLEAYYQEAGRAGRDEKKAYAVLLTQAGDLESMYQQLERRFPPLDKVRNVYHALGNYFRMAIGAGEGQTFSFDLGDFCKQYQLNALETQYSLQILEENGFGCRERSGGDLNLGSGTAGDAASGRSDQTSAQRLDGPHRDIDR
ncbi:MAG TPA: ATP-dependent DNA helicase RecQ, partial [Chitinophagales bacterium]|nr:ATP-dependent DNA helicase RecQ [Chitinophagales bacterium]